MQTMTVVFTKHELKIDLDKLQKYLKKKTFGVMGGLNFLLFDDSFVLVKNQAAFDKFREFAKKSESLISEM